MHARSDRVLTATPFYRMITLLNLCIPASGAITALSERSVGCPGTQVLVGKKAVITVTWKSKGSNRKVVLVKEFYDWRSL